MNRTNFVAHSSRHDSPELSHQNSLPFDNAALEYPPYQTSNGVPGVGPDGVFGSPYPMVASPGRFNDLSLELAEGREMPLGGFPGDHGINNWSSEYASTHAYMRAPGPTYGYPTRTAARSHTLTHNRTSVSVSAITGYSFSTMDPQRGSPFDLQREQAVSDGRSFSLPPPGLGYPLPVADPQYNYLGYQLNSPSVSAEANQYPQWLTRSSPSLSNGSPTPTPSEGEATGSLRQVRVGSDRTRAISHARRTNPNKKLHHCTIPGCGATLTSKHNFKSHQNSHLGIKPYPCGQGSCTKTFGTSAEAKRHRINHCSERSG